MGQHLLWIKKGKIRFTSRGIPILQLTRCRSEKQKETKIWIEKDGFKPGLLSDWRMVEESTFLRWL